MNSRPWLSMMPMTTSVPRLAQRRALGQHRDGLPDARRGAEVHPEPAPAAIGRLAFGGGRGMSGIGDQPARSFTWDGTGSRERPLRHFARLTGHPAMMLAGAAVAHPGPRPVRSLPRRVPFAGPGRSPGAQLQRPRRESRPARSVGPGTAGRAPAPAPRPGHRP